LAKAVLAGLVEVTFPNAENGFCVLRARAGSHHDLVTVVCHAATVEAGDWITASGERDNKGTLTASNFLRTYTVTCNRLG
jgi:exodeoxyribonuclease V alpha subunit